MIQLIFLISSQNIFICGFLIIPELYISDTLTVMIAVALLLTLLVLIFYAYYTLIIRPKKILKWYQQILEGMGYKVLVYPYKVLGSPIFDQFTHDSEKYGDQFYYLKHSEITYDLALFNILNRVVIQFYNPELIQQFLGPENPYKYYKVEPMIANIRRSLGEGIAFSEGQTWKRKRKIMNAVFNYDFIQANIPKIIRIINENFDIAEKQYALKNPSHEDKIYGLDILELYSCVFSNVMMECFFGGSSTYEKIQGQPIAVFMNKLNSDISIQSFKPLSMLLGVKYLELGVTQTDRDINRRIKILRSLAKQNIMKRLNQLEKEGAKEKSSDIIEAMYINNHFKGGDSSQSLNNYDLNELVDQFCTFYTAGTDTTAHFTQMVIYFMFQNPHVEKRLREEIEKHITCDAQITSQNLKKIKYLEWIQNETTRMYGPGTGIFIRYPLTEHYLKNIPIKKGIGLSIQPLVNHFSEKYYKDPLVFKPERWENGLTQNHPYAFGGFSGGPRTCIGKHLALLENKIAIVKFMLRYKDFSLPKKNFKLSHKFLTEAEPMQLKVILA